MKWNKVHNSPAMTCKRRYLRHHETREEEMLWDRLRNKQLMGCKFKRQHSVGGYILDFYCCSKRLAIELDGLQHFEPEGIRYDLARTTYLKSCNIQVLRFMNIEVTSDIQAVVDQILSVL